MQLRIYLTLKGMTITDFAKRLNYSRAQISKVMSGIYKAGNKLARLIEKETNGFVTAEEVLSFKRDDKDEE
tara:strand:- start:180 stop:392 length:213 start_codon:yes stop_codon:yes gene_type:complete